MIVFHARAETCRVPARRRGAGRGARQQDAGRRRVRPHARE